MTAATCAVVVFLFFVGATAFSSVKPQVIAHGDQLKQPHGYFRQVLSNDKDMSYFGDMKVGGQSLTGLIDTGSFEAVVWSKRCDSYDCVNSISWPKFYDANESTSYKNASLTQVLSYGSGDLFTQLGFDTMEIGPHNISNVYFWEAIRARMPIMQNSNFQAIIGVGPPLTADVWAQKKAQRGKELEEDYKNMPGGMPKALKEDVDSAIAVANESENLKTVLEQFQTTIYSVCLQPAKASAGFFVWNDYNPADFPDIFDKLPVADDEIWSPSLKLAKLKGGQTPEVTESELVIGCKSECQALLDSGTSLIAVPSPVAMNLRDALLKLDDPCGDIDKLPDLVFELGGKTHTLPPSSYIGEVYGGVSAKLAPFVSHWNLTKSAASLNLMNPPPKACQLMLMSSMDDNSWILGMPFFRTYYTTYHLGSEPLAPAKERSIYTAATDEICTHPGQVTSSALAAAVSFQRAQPIRQIDASKIQVSTKGWEFLHKGHKTDEERF